MAYKKLNKMGYKAKEQEFRTFPKLLLFCFISISLPSL